MQPNAFFFTYTLLVFFACGTGTILALTAAAFSKNRAAVPAAFLLLFYVIDLAVIFQNEWLVRYVDFSAENYYEIPSPALRIAFSAAFITCLWALLAYDVTEKIAPVVAIPTLLFVASSVLVVAALPYGPLRQWLFYSLRQVFMAAAAIYTLVQRPRAPRNRQRTGLTRRELIVLLVFLAAILVEDSIVILAVPPEHVEQSLLLYLQERNFSENIMMIWLAWVIARRSLDVLRAR